MLQKYINLLILFLSGCRAYARKVVAKELYGSNGNAVYHPGKNQMNEKKMETTGAFMSIFLKRLPKLHVFSSRFEGLYRKMELTRFEVKSYYNFGVLIQDAEARLFSPFGTKIYIQDKK